MNTTWRSPSLKDIDFRINAIESSVLVTPSSQTTTTDRDAVYLLSTDSTTENVFTIDIDPKDSSISDLEKIVLSVTGAELNGSTVSWTANGDATVLAKHPWLTRQIKLPMLRNTGQTYNDYQYHLEGSLGRAMYDGFDALLTSQELNVYTTKNNATNTYVRNPNCWVTADKTCWPVWSNGANRYCGALISPRHLICAKHAPPSGVVRFVTNSNVVVERTVSGSVDVGNLDLQVRSLDSDVPGTISFAKVLPADYLDYLPTRKIPSIAGNQQQELVIRESIWVEPEFDFPDRWIADNAFTERYVPFTKPIVRGDSGSPVFLLINNSLVVTGTHFGSFVSPSIAHWFADVNAAMTTLGGGYQLTPIDLSSFTNYGD
jgi:hypothetical protein